MPFDLTSVMNQVQAEESAQPTNDGSGFQYRLFYPGQVGTVTVKLLFNPATNLVGRIIYNHKIGKVNVPCMKTWDADCPICNALSAIDNVTGRNKSGDRSGGSPMRSTRRGISYAQLVEASYPIENIQPGDIMLLMYPQTVYNDIIHILSQAKTPDQFRELVAQNEGKVFEITHGKDNRYSTVVNYYQTYKTCNSDEEFEALLNGMDALTEQYRPSAPTEDIMNTVMKNARELEAQIGGNAAQPQFVNPNPAQQQVFTPYMGQPAAPAPTAAPQQPAAPVPPLQTPPATQPTNTPPWNASANFSGDPDIPFNAAPSATATAAPQQGTPARRMGFQVPTAAPATPAAPTAQAAPVAAPPVTAPAPPAAPAAPQQQSAPAYTSMGGDLPACYGMYGDPSVNKETCELCGSEIACNFATQEAKGR